MDRDESTAPSTAAIYSRDHLSGLTDGVVAPIANTSTPGSTLHTAHATSIDSVWLYVSNPSSSDETITVEWGGTGSGNQWTETIKAESGPVLVAPGLPLTNSKTVAAFSSTPSNSLNYWGHYIRST